MRRLVHRLSLSGTGRAARLDDVCQYGAVLRDGFRGGTTGWALTGLTVLALGLAGCGGPGGDEPASGSRPQFVEPSSAEPSTVPSAPETPSATPTTSASASPTPKKTSTSPKATTPKTNVSYVFPVKGNADYHPTHAKYPATDIFADCGEPVVATTDGVILEVSLKDTYVKGRPDGPANGGLSVSLLGDDGVRYYGSHLSKVKSGIKAGVRVKGGQRLGDVGRTGNANNVCHLHFGISPPCARTGDWKTRRGVIWPATYLDSWRGGGDKSPAAKVQSWQRSHNCKP
jgi:murein DD-endopeptidase MepM/ murein hydrolase activator NlpD